MNFWMSPSISPDCLCPCEAQQTALSSLLQTLDLRNCTISCFLSSSPVCLASSRMPASSWQPLRDWQVSPVWHWPGQRNRFVHSSLLVDSLMLVGNLFNDAVEAILWEIWQAPTTFDCENFKETSGLTVFFHVKKLKRKICFPLGNEFSRMECWIFGWKCEAGI